MYLFYMCVFSLSAATITAFNLDTKSPIIFQSEPGNYFGFSVALHRNRDGPMALIGAPRANSSVLIDQLHQPGVLFRCKIDSRECQEIVLDKKGNTQTDNRNSDFSYYDKKDDMWLGGSLDVQQNSRSNDIVTCGHLWKNQFYQKHYLANGACYVINGDLDQNNVTKLVPFVDKSKQAIIPPGIYKYAFGQVGTSAAFSEDGTYLLLGAPGYFDWTGTVVSYALNPEKQYQDYGQHAVPAPAGEHHATPETYLGYAVSSGKFYDDGVDYVAVGAPRDGGFHGRVYIYKALKSGEEKLLVHQKKEGVQFGEYFGAAVLGMNLNGDRFTDLLVGSPLYSSDTGVDEGKVYVFISNGMGLQLFTELYGKNKAYSRFGTAIANAGDLNQDDYNDVIIGAPYEDEKGAIYVYHGSRTGINVQYVQRISAAEIDKSLSGFGIQISRGFDIDANQYPDILVGSYASSNAVLFKTSPVVQMYGRISFSPNKINMNVTNCNYQGKAVPCLNVTVCLWYAGKHVPVNLDFEHHIYVEHTSLATNIASPRGFFLSNNQPAVVINQGIKLSVGTEECYTDLLYIRPQIKDFITPIQILYSYNLNGQSEDFDKSHPMMDPLVSNNVTSSVTFQTGCGSDDICNSDLSIYAVILDHKKDDFLIIGKNSTLTLSIEVANYGEPAYLTELFVYLPPELPSINQDICSELSESQNQEQNSSFICSLGNPLLHNQKSKTILMKLDLTKIPNDKKEVQIKLRVTTASIDPKDNSEIISLLFKAVADISITGTPSHEQIPYDVNTEGKLNASISHSYFVMNHGPSPVEDIDIKLYIPTSLQSKDNPVEFVVFTRLEIDSGKSSIQAECNDTYLQIKPALTEIPHIRDTDLDLSSNNSNTIVGLDNGIGDEETVIPARFKRSNEKRPIRKKKDLVINCQTANCLTIQCSASKFKEPRSFARITVSLQVNMSILNEYLDPWYSIEYVTSGEVFLRDDKKNSGITVKDYYPDKTAVKTIIVSPSRPASEEIDQWIIFVSIGIGILVLLIILILLIKLGFFKREQKEKMEKMRSKTDRKEYEPCEGESTENEALN